MCFLLPFLSQIMTILSDSCSVTNPNTTQAAQAARRAPTTISSFRDQNLKTGVFLLELVSAIEPRAVDWSVVTPGDVVANQMLNAKYAISAAMKIGACVFLTPEDIVEVKAKMLLTFIASLWMCDLARSF